MKRKLIVLSLFLFLAAVLLGAYYRPIEFKDISLSDSLDLFYVSYDEEHMTEYKKYVYGASGVGSLDVAGIPQEVEEISITSPDMMVVNSFFDGYAYRRVWHTYLSIPTWHKNSDYSSVIFHVNASPGLRSASTVSICSDGFMIYDGKSYFMPDAAEFITELVAILDSYDKNKRL